MKYERKPITEMSLVFEFLILDLNEKDQISYMNLDIGHYLNDFMYLL